MIYVLEIECKPMRAARTKGAVYAYADHDSAQRAARSLGARVVRYGPGDVRDEDLARVAEERLSEIHATRADLEAEQHGRFALRASYGAREDETMHQWIARLYRGHQRWQQILRDVRRMAEDDGEETGTR